MMEGTATLTMVADNTMDMAPIMPAMVTSQR